MEKPKTEASKKRRRITPEMLTALAAVLIGVSALFVSIYQASIMREQQRIMREQQRASVWPYLGGGTNYNSDGLRIRVTNQGVGPARIQAVEVTVDDIVMKTWSEVLSTLLETQDVPHVRRSINGRVMAPNFEMNIFELSPPLSDTVITKLNRVKMRLCYCSVYDECWTTKPSSPGVEPVEACELEEARQFKN